MKTYLLENIKNFKFMENILKLLIYFIPISLILGNAILNINSLLIILMLSILINSKKKFFSDYKKIYFIFIFFFSLLILNIFFSIDQQSSIKSSLGILRYFFLMVAILYCFEIDKRFYLNLSKFLFLIITFVALDTFYQYIFGQDIFGIKNLSNHGQRLNGPFGDEYVVGAYLSKLFFLSLFYFLINKKNFIILFIYLVLILLITLLTKERMASIMLILTSFIFLFFFQNIQFKKKLFIMISFLILISSFIYKNQSVKDHLVFNSIDQLGLNKSLKPKNKLNDSSNRLFFDSNWGVHFLTAYNIFLNNPLIGTGVKTFRKECGADKYDKINSSKVKIRCSTHPHNIYLEFISEGGLILFVPFIILNFYIFYKLALNIFNKKKDRDISLVTFCGFLILFFPIQTTGSFFSTWNGIYYWLIYAFVIHDLINKKSQIQKINN